MRCGANVTLGFMLGVAIVLVYTAIALSTVSQAVGQGK